MRLTIIFLNRRDDFTRQLQSSKIFAAIGLIVLALTIRAQVISQPQKLFHNEAIALSVKTPIGQAVKRFRIARLNSEALSSANQTSAPQKVVLNLFDDEAPTVVIDRTESVRTKSLAYFGHFENELFSQVIISKQEDVIAAYVFSPAKGLYQVQYAGNGLHKIIQLDPAKTPWCGVNPAIPQLTSAQTDSLSLAHSFPPHPLHKDDITPQGAASTSCPEVGLAIMDIMVVYTADALAGAGGTNGIETQINLGIALANTIYQNSHINARLNLVFTGQPSSVNPDFGDLATERVWLKTPDDGAWDEVFAWREQYQADLICLIVEKDDGTAGIADGMIWPAINFQDSCFSIVVRNYATTEIFAHEIGHNLGCAHDRPNAANAGVFSYSYGYRFDADTNTYRTVMAYEPGIRVPYFSSPDILFMGVPVGIAEGSANAADNARTINLTSPIVASYRGRPMNDDFDCRTVLSGTSLTVYDGTRFATKEAGEPYHAGNQGGKSVWWTWTPPASGRATITTAGSTNPTNNFDTLLAIYTGDSVSNLTLIVSNNDGAPLQTSLVSFDAYAGTNYQIAVDGFDGAYGTVVLGISLNVPQLINLTTFQDIDAGQFRLRLTGQPDLNFAVEASTNLIGWTSLQTNKSTTGQFDFTDTNLWGLDQRYYRARQIEQ